MTAEGKSDSGTHNVIYSLNLNDRQLAAVTHTTGPLRIIAGAGTGKTQTLTSRFVHLVNSGQAPAHQILALTFSRKAADEMRSRVLARLEGGYRDLWIQTFHAFCLRLLTEWQREAGQPPLQVFDDQAQGWLAGRAVEAVPDAALRYYHGAAGRQRLRSDLLTLIKRSKEHLLTAAEIDAYAHAKEGVPSRLHDLAAALHAYQAALAVDNVRDFGDLAMHVVQALQADPELREQTQKRFVFVLVDEFQDTNKAQFELLRLLVPPGGPICVVGDPNQAIYSFRGGKSEYIREFDRHFPGAATIELTANYRSGPPILDAANTLLLSGGADYDFKLVAADTAAPGTVTVLHSANADHEAEQIARRILTLVRDPNRSLRFSQIAILVRSFRSSGDPLMRALTGHGIPYRLGTAGAVQGEVAQDLVAALRLTAGPARWEDATRLAVARGAVAGAFRALEGRFDRIERAMLLAAPLMPPGLPAGQLAALRGAWEIAREAVAARDADLPHLAYHAILLSGHLRAGETPVTGRFLSAILEQATAFAETGGTVAEFVERIAAGYDQDEDEAPDDPGGVHLLTVHAAKGLEWPVVFVAGLADGLFPLPMRLDRDFDLDELADWGPLGTLTVTRTEAERAAIYLREERRLAYVAITRGREEVYLSVPKSGPRGALPPSPFVAEAGFGAEIDALLADDGPPATVGELARSLRNRRQRALVATLDDPDAEQHLATLLLAQWAGDGIIDGAMPLRDRLIPEPFGDGHALRLSFSQLDTYERCSRQYLYNAVLKLEREEEAAQLALGNAVHEALKKLNETWRSTGQPPHDDAIQAALEEAWPSGGFDCEPQRTQLRLRASAMLRRFYNRERERVPVRLPISIEEAFRVTYGEHMVSGRVDAVLRDAGGNVEIVDFKTGKPDSYKKPEESLQLFIYDYAWRMRDPEITPRVAYYALRHKDDKGFVTAPAWDPEQEIGLVHGEESASALRTRMDGLIASILANQFTPNPGDACSNCKCRWLCPEG